MCSSRTRKGFTVVELSIAAALFLLIAALAASLYYGQGRQVERLGHKADLADTAREAWFGLTEELRTGIDLLSPAPGSAPTPYLLFTNEHYELIAYWVEVVPPSGPAAEPSRRLMRMNFNDPAGRHARILAPSVDRVLFERRGPQQVDVKFMFRDSDRNSLVLTAGITVRNAVAVD